MVIVSLTAMILMYILLYGKSKSLIRAAANTWITITAFVWISTELLSVFRGYTSTNMLLCWGFLLMTLAFLIYKQNVKNTLVNVSVLGKHIKALWSQYKIQCAMLIVFWLIIMIGSGLRSLSNVDSHAYHLSRIMHWIVNESVWPYGPGNALQIRYPALAEFLVAQIYLMGLPDRLASLVQACAFLLSGVLVYGISRKMNVSGKTAFAGVFIFYCSPIALSQAFTTQTDNVAAVFLMIYVYFILDFIQSEKLSGGKGLIRDGVRLSACLMFGFLCKPTICFAMVVFFAWMWVVRIVKRDKVSLLASYVVVGAITAILLYVPLMARTYEIYYADSISVVENEVLEKDAQNVTDEEMSRNATNVLVPDGQFILEASNSPKKLFTSFLLNYCRSSSSAVFPKWNMLLSKVVNWAGESLNCTVSGFALQEGYDFFQHDTASSPVILIGMAVMCITLLARRCRLSKQQKIFICCAVAGFVIQCAFMVFSLYRGRYLVGVMAILCVAFAITLDNLKAKEQIKTNIMVGIMVIASIGAINTLSYEAFNIRDGFTGRHVRQYLVNNTWLEKEFAALFDFVNEHGYKNVGLYSKFDYEYIAWREIENLERLEVVNVGYPEYQKYEDMNFHPECIIRENTPEPEEIIECHGKSYKLV